MHNQMLLLKPSHVFFESIECEPFFLYEWLSMSLHD